MKSSDLRKLTSEELRNRVREEQDNLFKLKIRHATGQLESTATLRTAHRNLARALTIQRASKDTE